MHSDIFADHIYIQFKSTNYKTKSSNIDRYECLNQPLVLIMVIVPLPWVWILVSATTAFPDRPGPWGDTHGRHAKSPTGCLTGLVGGISIRSFMSFNVTSPSLPPGFTSAKGYTTLVITSGLFLFLILSHPAHVLQITRAKFFEKKENAHQKIHYFKL